jgi:hypothetical protein
MTTNSEDIKEQAGNEAKVTNRFIRIIQLKDLPWEKDSIARAANDPEHIPDCNFQATVGQHFLFHEPIPKTANGQGYLRVTTKSLWWRHEQFPTVWTAEGLSTCIENGYQWTINSTMWNHLQVKWQGQPLDLLRRIHEEVISRTPSKPVGTDPQHGEFCGHYNLSPKLRYSWGNQWSLQLPFLRERDDHQSPIGDLSKDGE